MFGIYKHHSSKFAFKMCETLVIRIFGSRSFSRNLSLVGSDLSCLFGDISEIFRGCKYFSDLRYFMLLAEEAKVVVDCPTVLDQPENYGLTLDVNFIGCFSSSS